MIQSLSARFRRPIAGGLSVIFLLQALPFHSLAGGTQPPSSLYRPYATPHKKTFSPRPGKAGTEKPSLKKESSGEGKILGAGHRGEDFIGGPSQPEMASFKPVGTDNLVNLFTGDFSYNIPLLDVGGYPVNIFYNSGITMDQDASWVGLGWNINPGSVNRNMRGVPDDFDGTEKLVQTQSMKPNVTWGANLGADVELVGIKNVLGISLGISTGLSFNNYLGPAISQGIKGGLVFGLPIGSEKSVIDSLKLRIGVSAELGSRSGFALSPNVSLTASHNFGERAMNTGLSLSTSYNSRSGIKGMQVSEQLSFSRSHRLYEMDANNKPILDKYKDYGSSNSFTASSSITFTKPSYIPAMRMPVTNSAYSGHFQIGGSIWGIMASAEAEVYKQKAEVAIEDRVQAKPMVGYLHYGAAKNNPQAVMDFSRLNDKEVTASTPIISAPQYSYDVFSIQGEGTGGSIRLYRNDIGYVRDNYTRSKDKNISAGVDIGIPGQIGVNFNLIKTPTTIGEWGNGNSLRSLAGFGKSAGLTESVYFRNPGETSVLQPGQYNNIGNTDLVRFRLGGTNSSPSVLQELEKFRKNGYKFSGADADGDGSPNEPEDDEAFINVRTKAAPLERAKRTQVTSFLTAAEATEIGLDKNIRSYQAQAIAEGDTLKYENLPRVSVADGRLANHISQINVNEADGKRYVYGLPVYNVTQQDFTFSVAAAEVVGNPDRVTYSTAAGMDESDVSTSPHLDAKSKTKRDGFYQKTETPPYAHSYLLSGLLSPDYVDVDGNGITENDLGTAVRFNYTRVKNGSAWANYKWRTPFNQNEANSNPGNLSETKDDKALFTYGERESWYMHSIESKTMIAIFTLEDRKDGKGVTGVHGGINTGDKSLKRLKKIDLYSKADVKGYGTAGAKPVKTVNFEYSYRLCANTPGNNTEAESYPGGSNVNTGKGKLTLEKIYFTYNGKSRASREQYVFNYGDAAADNPAYANSSADRWGTYKPAGKNPDPTMKNRDYPYSLQAADAADPLLTDIKANASAWSLKKILLPSGGQLEVSYEADDYAWVQDKRAMDMTSIIGFGHTGTNVVPSDFTSQNLYEVRIGANGQAEIYDNEYVLVSVPTACANPAEVYKRYLDGAGQLAFRLAVRMPKNNTVEYITCYADIEEGYVDAGNTIPKGYGVLSTDNKKIWLRLRPVDSYGPLSLTVLEYLREQLPGQAYPGSDVSEEEGIEKVGKMLGGMLDALECAFTKPVNCFREKGLARNVQLSQCFVRLNDPDGFKYGGGLRVKKVLMRDNWKSMTISTANPAGQYNSVYGNQYDYTTEEVFNGVSRTVSSGVASYEPSIGGEENPFQTIVKVANTLPLGPTSYGAVEMPVLDAFFPSPLVGYSKVTVRSLNENTDPANLKLRSGSGKQVHRFYTAKDYPVYYSHTNIDADADKQEHRSSTLAFFTKYAFDSRAVSQGFLVATNDMHGKVMSQASYAETDPNTPVTYTEYSYKNTGVKGMDEKFSFAYPVKEGTDAAILPGNMGIDIELMTDAREFSVKGRSLEVQGQLDLFPVIFPVWLPFIWPVIGENESTYRAVTTTKVISYHSVVDKVVAIDKGSQVSTENLVYDAETGNVMVTKTNNEFDQPIYNVTYPAWWAYGGMGLAYKNIDAVYTGMTFDNGVISMPVADQRKVFESGDELYITGHGSAAGCTPDLGYQSAENIVWAFDKKKETTSLVTPQDFIFIDKEGNPYNRAGVSFRIVRSGHRNMLGAPLASVTLMDDPLMDDPNHTGWKKLKAFMGATSVTAPGNKVINASAVEYKEKWQTDNDMINKYKVVVTNCVREEVPDCVIGYLDKSINPYLKGLVGNFKGYKNWVFYANRQQENFTASTVTNIPKDGFLKDFSRFWSFQTNTSDNTDKRWAPPVDPATTKWVSNSEATRFNSRGMELETVDALGVFTSALYGYHKSMPLAVANNSPYQNMFSDGFEEYAYDERLNVPGVQGCEKRHIDFSSGLSNSSVLNTETLAAAQYFGAHTGKSVLAVSNGGASKEVPLENVQTTSFPLTMEEDNTKELYNIGGNFSKLPESIPSVAPVSGHDPTFTFTNLGMSMDFGPHNVIGQIINGSSVRYYFKYKTVQYTKVTTPGSYNLNISTYQYDIPLESEPPPYIFNNSAMTVTIKNLDNIQAASFTIYGTQSPVNQLRTVSLTCDTYVIECVCSVDIQRQYVSPSDGFHAFKAGFSYTSNIGTISYKNLIPYIPCTYTKPIAAVSTMINPVFSPEKKKMMMSGWVRRNCVTAGTCDETIKVSYNDVITQVDDISASGPVIEGWQRFEGVFTIPLNATVLKINFKNITGQTIYFDDIRIHPYSANMKSFVYDPVSLRLRAELDANNYASFYEYDEEGTLVRTKVETQEGIKTITETRSAKQKSIVVPQP